MGRSFESLRMGVNELSARWTRAGRALKKRDQIYAKKLADMAKMHSSEAFYALDDPLEAAVFSVLIELLKERDSQRDSKRDPSEDSKRDPSEDSKRDPSEDLQPGPLFSLSYSKDHCP